MVASVKTKILKPQLVNVFHKKISELTGKFDIQTKPKYKESDVEFSQTKRNWQY